MRIRFIAFLLLFALAIVSAGCSRAITTRTVVYNSDGTTETTIEGKGAEIGSVRRAENERDANMALRQSSREVGQQEIEEASRRRQLAQAELVHTQLARGLPVCIPATREVRYPILVRNHSRYARSVYIWQSGIDDPYVYELNIAGSSEGRIDLMPAGEYTFRITKNGGHNEMHFRWRDNAGVSQSSYRPTFIVAPTPVCTVNGVAYFRDIHLPGDH